MHRATVTQSRCLAFAIKELEKAIRKIIANVCAFGRVKYIWLTFKTNKTESPILVQIINTLTVPVPCTEKWGLYKLNSSLESIVVRVVRDGADSFSLRVLRSGFLLWGIV